MSTIEVDRAVEIAASYFLPGLTGRLKTEMLEGYRTALGGKNRRFLVTYSMLGSVDQIEVEACQEFLARAQVIKLRGNVHVLAVREI